MKKRLNKHRRRPSRSCVAVASLALSAGLAGTALAAPWQLNSAGIKEAEAKSSAGGGSYVAEPARPVPGKQQIRLGFFEWQCQGTLCVVESRQAPGKNDCNQLAAKVGKLNYCGPKDQYRGARSTATPDKNALLAKMGKRSGSSSKKPAEQTAPARPSGVITTATLEVIGSPNPPPAELPPFTPVTVTTSGLEVIGNPNMPAEDLAPFTPVNITTRALEVIGSPIR